MGQLSAVKKIGERIFTACRSLTQSFGQGRATFYQSRYSQSASSPTDPASSSAMCREYEFDLAVRYYETDAQGFVHHANYLKYLEIARIEQLRAAGIEYADMEADDYLLVVSKIECRYVLPSRFGDTLRIWLRTERARGARVEHRYKITRGVELVFEAKTTLACIDRQGRLRRLPEHLEINDE